MTRNRCQCLLCGDVIESKYRHDFVSCKCRAIFTDGGKDYIRRGAKSFDNIIDLGDKEPYTDHDLDQFRKALNVGLS